MDDQQQLSAAVWNFIEKELGIQEGEVLPQEAEELHIQIMDYAYRKTGAAKLDLAQVMNDIGGAY